MEDVSLKLKLKHTFVTQRSDAPIENIEAAIITAASKMSLVSGIATEEQTISELMSLYELNEEQFGKLIGMNPNFVKSLIGYSVNYTDYSRAKVNYDANKSDYDIIYNEIAERSLNKKVEKQI